MIKHCATLFTKNILPALNKVAWPQSVKEKSSSKSFSSSDSISAKGNAFTSIKSTKEKHHKIFFFRHLNLNSIRNTLVRNQELIKRTSDIFLIGETKIDDSFQMRSLKLKVIKVLGKIEMSLEEDFSFTLMKSQVVDPS